MEALPFALVLLSTVSHAYWNYLIKRSSNKHIFTALSKLAETTLFAIPAVYFLLHTEFQPNFLLLISVAALITSFNYYFLSQAYQHGDLSLVYPLSRSSILFLPVLAYFTIGETIDLTGFVAIVLIVLAVLIIHLRSLSRSGLQSLFHQLHNKGTVFALLAALTVAGYTLWDKIAIRSMQPFLYFYLYTVLITIVYSSFTILFFRRSEIKSEWQRNKSAIIQVGFFNSFTYILVLIALTT
ncbi:MAG: EamA family transporter, partial [Calditrichaeota bacterium]|nr:EamA family transporter [Calditrichota bacterium]